MAARLVFVDCEATGPCPGMGQLTEFGAVDYETRRTWHGVLFESEPLPSNPAMCRVVGEAYSPIDAWSDFDVWLRDLGPGRLTMVSDNPAFDFQWINYGFHHALGRNPFGHSARRIGDLYAGLTRNVRDTQGWKRLRVTPHDHNPVNDAVGNVEAFAAMLDAQGLSYP